MSDSLPFSDFFGASSEQAPSSDPSPSSDGPRAASRARSGVRPPAAPPPPPSPPSPGAFERVHAAMGRFKAWCAALTIVGAGGVLIWGPAPLLEEIPPPWNVRVGAGFLAFGLLFVVALAGRGALAARARSLLLATVCAAIVAGVGLWLGGPVRDAWVLRSEGVAVTGRVTSRTLAYQTRGSRVRHVVAYPGGSARFSLAGNPDRGAPVALLVHPDRPEIVSPGAPGEAFLELLARRVSLGGAALGVAVLLFCAVACLVLLRDTLLGAPPDPATTARR